MMRLRIYGVSRRENENESTYMHNREHGGCIP